VISAETSPDLNPNIFFAILKRKFLRKIAECIYHRVVMENWFFFGRCPAYGLWAALKGILATITIGITEFETA
jgi:hypothetical protein